jgi:hypothetical protein
VHAAPYQAAPASVVDYLEVVLAPQRRFLQDRFGMPFAREILRGFSESIPQTARSHVGR